MLYVIMFSVDTLREKHIGTEQRWNEWREEQKIYMYFLSIKFSITFNNLTVLIVGAE